ncbi:MAG TPA: thioredoxin domain-containing protein, partial [Chromatiales bacterium]|nr:thioredoxin domain-containing protein [Chromatiales bacterium]
MTLNALARETSPYLLQHARNPVEWYPWGTEALELAVRQDKPILLSIGYSACHWCHVMAHESFENEATAALMNKYFINIKVDREERPDLDKIYQTAHHLLMGRGGGWPLTLFLTPGDLTPFYSGTYFPREARHGLPAFGDLLRQAAGYYASHRAEISEQNGRLLAALRNLVPASGQAHLDAAPLDLAFQQLLQEFDERHGGFGGAPKFPQPARLEFLLRYWHASVQGGHPNAQALRMARLTLICMARGGLHDLLGGGFYRYAVDEAWTIPHFEKMLNDNALLLTLYAWLVAAGEADPPGGTLHSTVEKIFQWITKDMQSQQGGFFAARDADSAGKEGWFYLWDREEIRAILPAGEYRLFAPAHGLDRAPNFEGRWHLQRIVEDDELADRTGVAANKINQALGRARARLL